MKTGVEQRVRLACLPWHRVEDSCNDVVVVVDEDDDDAYQVYHSLEWAISLDDDDEAAADMAGCQLVSDSAVVELCCTDCIEL